jgi:hypothetical protein
MNNWAKRSPQIGCLRPASCALAPQQYQAVSATPSILPAAVPAGPFFTPRFSRPSGRPAMTIWKPIIRGGIADDKNHFDHRLFHRHWLALRAWNEGARLAGFRHGAET